MPWIFAVWLAACPAVGQDRRLFDRWREHRRGRPASPPVAGPTRWPARSPPTSNPQGEQLCAAGIRPTNDFAFMETFGTAENKAALISLLNAILVPQVPIADVAFPNPFNQRRFQGRQAVDPGRQGGG